MLVFMKILPKPTLEFCDIAPVFIFSRMIFNFNPKEYCFSSAIPDNFVMTGFQGDVVTIWIFLNRGVSPIFSTDIAAYKDRASIYDLRGIIEGYMETHGLAFATCTLKF